jgi:hypothetical protein
MTDEELIKKRHEESMKKWRERMRNGTQQKMIKREIAFDKLKGLFSNNNSKYGAKPGTH